MFRTEPEMMNPDIVFLQEMDEVGVKRISEALGLGNTVYYPALLHPQNHKNFGNAILTRWPIEEDQKLLLPHLGQWGHTLRIGVRATLRIGDQRVRVYALHLATWIELGPGRRSQQAETIMADADTSPYPVIIAGDTNGSGVWKGFERRGYRCLTHGIGKTSPLGAFDHIFVRGMNLDSSDARGKVAQHKVSDHSPVWALLKMPAASDASVVQRTAD
jgi:endonuclease/exonuclease/phosphatase family metal-dependent hydrolase